MKGSGKGFAFKGCFFKGNMVRNKESRPSPATGILTRGQFIEINVACTGHLSSGGVILWCNSSNSTRESSLRLRKTIFTSTDALPWQLLALCNCRVRENGSLLCHSVCGHPWRWGGSFPGLAETPPKADQQPGFLLSEMCTSINETPYGICSQWSCHLLSTSQ